MVVPSQLIWSVSNCLDYGDTKVNFPTTPDNGQSFKCLCPFGNKIVWCWAPDVFKKPMRVQIRFNEVSASGRCYNLRCSSLEELADTAKVIKMAVSADDDILSLTFWIERSIVIDRNGTIFYVIS